MTQLSAASMDTLPAKRITANCSNPYLLKKIYSCLELCDTLKIRHSLNFLLPICVLRNSAQGSLGRWQTKVQTEIHQRVEVFEKAVMGG